MNTRPFWLTSSLFLSASLRADSLTAAEQYNQKAREIISQCSRVEIEHEFVADRAGMDFIPIAKIGLTPRQADFLARAISVDRAVERTPDIGGNYSSLSFTFYNGKKWVASAGSHLTSTEGDVVLLPQKQPHADYTLRPEIRQNSPRLGFETAKLSEEIPALTPWPPFPLHFPLPLRAAPRAPRFLASIGPCFW